MHSDRPKLKIFNTLRRKFRARIGALIATMGAIGFVGCLLTLFTIVKLSHTVLAGEVFALDQTILLWIHQIESPILDSAMLAITQLGNPSFTVPIFTTSTVLLWWQRYRPEAYLFILNCLGGAILSNGLKLVFSKPRPKLWPQLITETSFSYPSGHALGSMVMYGFLAYLIARFKPRFRIASFCFAGGLISAIGFSRLYLGVHWPTDIIGGYGIGFLWLSICITLLNLKNNAVS